MTSQAAAQAAMREQLSKIKPPPIPRDFAKLIPADSSRLNPPQTVKFLEYLTQWINASPKIPAQATIERNGWNMTIHIAVTIQELPPAPGQTTPTLDDHPDQ